MDLFETLFHPFLSNTCRISSYNFEKQSQSFNSFKNMYIFETSKFIVINIYSLLMAS